VTGASSSEKSRRNAPSSKSIRRTLRIQNKTSMISYLTWLKKVNRISKRKRRKSKRNLTIKRRVITPTSPKPKL
jgi:hypothetical protein